VLLLSTIAALGFGVARMPVAAGAPVRDAGNGRRFITGYAPVEPNALERALNSIPRTMRVVGTYSDVSIPRRVVVIVERIAA
jgi:hypothetical protein